MKISILHKAIISALLLVFLAGQIVVSFHSHDHLSQTKSGRDQAKKEANGCNICHLNAHPAFFTCSTQQRVLLTATCYRYVLKRVSQNHEVIIYHKCGRGPPGVG